VIDARLVCLLLGMVAAYGALGLFFCWWADAAR
jgi:hypothetical protein